MCHLDVSRCMLFVLGHVFSSMHFLSFINSLTFRMSVINMDQLMLSLFLVYSVALYRANMYSNSFSGLICEKSWSDSKKSQ